MSFLRTDRPDVTAVNTNRRYGDLINNIPEYIRAIEAG